MNICRTSYELEVRTFPVALFVRDDNRAAKLIATCGPLDIDDLSPPSPSCCPTKLKPCPAIYP